MASVNQWKVKGEADLYHPDTETQEYLFAHGMDAEPVYVLPSNPISQASIDGRCLQVYHVKQDNVTLPVEAELANTLRYQTLVSDPIEESHRHLPDRVERSSAWRLPFAQFSWVDTSVGTAKRVLGYIGENLYGLVNPPKPSA